MRKSDKIIGIGYRDSLGAILMEGDEVTVKETCGAEYKGRIEYNRDLHKYEIHITHDHVRGNYWIRYGGAIERYIPPERYLARRKWRWPWQTCRPLRGVLLRRRKASLTELNDNMYV